MKRFVPMLQKKLLGGARTSPPVPVRDRSLPSVSVASYNIHKCVGTDGLFDPRRIEAVLLELNADIVALQEVDARFGAAALLAPG